MFIPTSLRRARLSRAWLVVVLSLGLPVPAVAQGTSGGRGGETRADDGMPADIKAAQAFILSAYPDLYGRPLEFTLRQDGEAVLVSVADLSVTRTPGQPLTPLVTARVEYDAHTSLRRFDAYGPLVEEARNLKLQEALIENPRWIDSDADVWLMREGVASTVGAVSPRVSPEATRTIEQQMGVTRSATAKFLWHQEGTEAAAVPVFRSRPAWVTEATMTGPDGASVVYQFEYEPFAGRLIAVTQRGGR